MSVAPEIIRWSLNMNREFYWMVHIYCWDHNRSNFNKTRLTLSWNIDPCPLAKAGMAISLAESHAFTTLPAGRLWGEALGPGKPLGNHWETTGNLWKFDIWVAIYKIRNDGTIRDPFVYVARPIWQQWIQAIDNTSFWQRRNCWSSELKGWSAIWSPSCTSGRHGLD